MGRLRDVLSVISGVRMRRMVLGLVLVLTVCVSVLSGPRATADEPHTMRLLNADRMIGQLIWLQSVTPCSGVGGRSWGDVVIVIRQGDRQWAPADEYGDPSTGAWNLQQWLSPGFGAFADDVPVPGSATIEATCNLVVNDYADHRTTAKQFDYDPVTLNLTPGLSAPSMVATVAAGQPFTITSTSGCPLDPDPSFPVTPEMVERVTVDLYRPGTRPLVDDSVAHVEGWSRSDGTFALSSTLAASLAGSTYDVRVWCDGAWSGDNGYSFPVQKLSVTAEGTDPGEPAPDPGASAAFVALGDSYSSGEGNGPFRSGSDTSVNACHRSDLAYGPQLALGYPGFPGKLGTPDLVACSGATTEDLFSPNHTQNLVLDRGLGHLVVEPAQLDAVGAATKLVTLTIGGDDAGFADVLAQCVVVDLGDPKCRSSAEANKAEQSIKVLAGKTKYKHPTQHTYVEVLKAIHAKAPKAKILIGGYPRLVATTKSAMKVGHCSVGSVHYFGRSDGVALFVYRKDAEWLNDQADALNKAIKAAVDKSGVKKAVYVPAGGFDGHELCTKKPYLFRVSGQISAELPPETKEIDASSFHPTPAGQAEYRKAFLKKVP